MNVTNFRVRRAESSDLDTLVSFTLAEAKEAEGLVKDRETIRRGVKTGLADSSISRYWILESEEGELIGSASAIREWSDWNAAFYWWIQSMYIKPELRGRGLMRELIQAIGDAARAEGALELRLYVHKDNVRAIHAYLREGFSEVPHSVMARKL